MRGPTSWGDGESCPRGGRCRNERNPRHALPHCPGAVGSSTLSVHCLPACGVVWCGVVWRGVAWCGVLWCGVPKVLLPEGNGRDVYPQVHVNGRAVCLARAPCVSVWLTAERATGKPGCHALGDYCHPRSSRCTHSLSLSACWCRRSSCSTHAIVLLGPRRAFNNVARALAWAYQTLMDSSMTLRMNSVPSVWGPEHPMWARYMEGVRKAAANCSGTAGSHSWWCTDTA